MRRTIAIAFAFAGLSALAGTTAALGKVLSDIHIEPGREAVLGDGSAGAFAISGQNVGSATVRIVARTPGHDRLLAQVEPGAHIAQSFAYREAAVAINASPASEAVLMLRVGGHDATGAAGGMRGRYEGE